MNDPERKFNPEHLTGQLVEVGGISVKCIASNIRRLERDWNFGLEVVQGIGKEGDLVVVEALSDSGSTTHVENQTGRDERIYRGDRFVGVLANRFSGTSESGEVPKEGIKFCDDTIVHLLSTGGVIGINTGIPHRMRQEPFALRPLGVLHKGDKDPQAFIPFISKNNPKETILIGDRVRSELLIGYQLGATTIWVKQGKFAAEEPEVEEQ